MEPKNKKNTADIFFKAGDKRFRLRACGIILKDNHVLMVKNDVDDYFYSLGGAVHVGESLEEACLREVLEETGFPYEIERLLFIHEHLFDKGEEVWHELTFHFLMKSSDNNTFNESIGSFGSRETKVWIPLERYGEFKAYPEFFKEELINLPDSVKLISFFH